jgi:hypothetical protein
MLGITPIVYPSIRRGGPGGADVMVIVQSRAMFATLPSKRTGSAFTVRVMDTVCLICARLVRIAQPTQPTKPPNGRSGDGIARSTYNNRDALDREPVSRDRESPMLTSASPPLKGLHLGRSTPPLTSQICGGWLLRRSPWRRSPLRRSMPSGDSLSCTRRTPRFRRSSRRFSAPPGGPSLPVLSFSGMRPVWTERGRAVGIDDPECHQTLCPAMRPRLGGRLGLIIDGNKATERTADSR